MMSEEFVGLVIDGLAKLEIPFMLVGSFSSNFYGIPRSTKDADFVLQLENIKLQALVALLSPGFQFDEQMSFETITSTMRYRMRHRESAFLVELFELSADPHDQARFARRSPKPLFGRTAFLPTAEDVIITKLRWSKGGNRQKDVEDVRNVIAIQMQNLDLPYIRQWCDAHATRELFEGLLTDAASQI
jgi:hypothetical protein